MKRRGIKNLIIDFGGVLIDLDRQRCLENFRKLGLPDVEVMLDLYHQQDFFQKYEKGLITSAEFREVIRGKIGKPVTDAQIDDAWNSFLVSIPTFKLDLLLELRKKYVVYLLSNIYIRSIRPDIHSVHTRHQQHRYMICQLFISHSSLITNR